MNSANNVWDVFVLEYARSRNQPWVDLVSGMYEEGGVDLPFSFILARSGDRNVLIDTGFMQGEGCSSFPQKFAIPTWISPVAMIEHAGLSADAITDIVLTHAHFDHMGSIGQFRNARLYIQRSELLSWYEAIALPKRYGYLTAIIDPLNLREALDASIEHRVTLIDGDKGQHSARPSCAARQRSHHRAAIRHFGNGTGAPSHLQRLRLFKTAAHRSW